MSWPVHISRWRWKPLAMLFFWLTLLLTLLTGQPAPAVINPLTSEIRGVWLTTNDTDVLVDRPRLHEAIDQLARLHFNTLYPVVWNSGYALFPSLTAQQAGIQPFVRRGRQDYDVLSELIAQAHGRKLLVMPWFEFGFMAPPTSELALNHPDWLTQRRNGDPYWVGAAGEVVWLNPFKPEVQEFLTSLVLELVSRYDVDGIQFDDHFSLPVAFGYDSYTTNLYKQETGKEAPADPHNPDWVNWRAHRFTEFVTRLQAAIKARKPHVALSIAPNPYDFAFRGQLQDWLTWVRQDLVDELIVQVYRNDLGAFREHLSRPEVQEVRQKIPTAVGVLTGLRNAPVTMSFIQAKVQSARAFGLGVAFFFFESLWEDSPEPPDVRKSGFQALFLEPISRFSAQWLQ